MNSIFGSLGSVGTALKGWINQLIGYLGIFASKYPFWIIIIVIVMFVSKGKLLQIHLGGKTK